MAGSWAFQMSMSSTWVAAKPVSEFQETLDRERLEVAGETGRYLISEKRPTKLDGVSVVVQVADARHAGEVLMEGDVPIASRSLKKKQHWELAAENQNLLRSTARVESALDEDRCSHEANDFAHLSVGRQGKPAKNVEVPGHGPGAQGIGGAAHRGPDSIHAEGLVEACACAWVSSLKPVLQEDAWIRGWGNGGTGTGTSQRAAGGTRAAAGLVEASTSV
ncbi:hypothetical protein G7046_g1634 [Stylonectria norvegica]|nr:hypothetical protein G7046_g1634 [Stylonectria norvegica]